MKVKSLSHVRLLVTPQTAAYQAPLSMGFSRQEYWSGVPLPSPDAPLWGKANVSLQQRMNSTVSPRHLEYAIYTVIKIPLLHKR